MNNNHDVYESAETVDCYSHDSYIFKPESTVLANIKTFTNCESMLDIGMGAGRTTLHFSHLFKRYVGLDFSKSMVDISTKRFKNSPNCSFIHGDARQMKMFSDSIFDFILFSFNGIDCVSIDDRIKVLQEVKRVAVSGATFFFSFHNSYAIPKLFNYQFPKNPCKYYKEYKRFKGVNRLNSKPEILLQSDFVLVKDGDWNFKAEYVYAKPEAQIAQLKHIGFENIQLWSLKNGKQIFCNNNYSSITDDWVHITCTIKK